LQIAAVGHGFPEHYYDQQELLAALREHWAERHFNLERLERLHHNVLVGGRHLALPIDEYPKLDGWGDANDAWIRVGLEVGETAMRQALERAGLGPGDVDCLIVVSVTGI